MRQGVLLFAYNNSEINYVKQAIYCAKRIKKHLNLPVALVSDNNVDNNIFDKVIITSKNEYQNLKRFNDGLGSQKILQWNNYSRSQCYNLTPFEETLVLDTDLMISNNNLLQCFDIDEDFLISSKSIDILATRKIDSFKRISDTSIDMYWATIFYFKKSELTSTLFKLIEHVQDNYEFYRLTYNISEKKFRNDYAFSIAIHMLSGFQKIDWPKDIPATLFHTIDKDILIKIQNENMTFLLENNQLATTKNMNVHVMNKFSLDRMIDV